jgi:chromate transporter
MIYLKLFFEFFKIGLFTFGGGYAMIPLVKEVVLKYDWLTESAFYDFIGICESTPGPIAVNMATYIGSTQGGILGSLSATLGVILPSFIIILLIASLLKKFVTNKYFKAFMDGVKPIVIGLIVSTGLLLIAKCVGYNKLESFNFDYKSLIIFLLVVAISVVFEKIFKKKINTILIIVISACLGIIINLF